MRPGLWALLAASALVAPCAQALEPGEPAPDQIARLVRTLGDADFAARQDAFAQLLAAGARGPEGVLKALPEDPDDPEVAERCEKLRRRIPWEHERFKALAAAGPDGKLREAVEALFEHPSQERMYAAVEAFGERKAQAAETVAAFLAHEDPETCRRAVCVLGNLPQAVGLISGRLLAMLQDPSMRFVAARALGHLKVREAAPRLADLLTDPDKQVRDVSAESLALIRSPDVVPQLEKLLESDNREFRIAAASLLGRLGSRGSAGKVLALAGAADPEARLVAIDALGRLGEPSVAPDLAGFLADPEPKVRLVAQSALERLRAKSAAAKLASLLGHEEREVRMRAAYTLGKVVGQEWPSSDTERLVETAKAWWAAHGKDPAYQGGAEEK